MEADWSAEIGPELPVIVAPWEGFVDLRRSPERVMELEEAMRWPTLSESLLIFNASGSPVFTSKCDRWLLEAGEIDRFEFDATQEEAVCGVASYIDVIARNADRRCSFAWHEQWARRITTALRAAICAAARVELVLRPALVDGHEGFGLTLYAFGCGPVEGDAERTWARALAAAVAATMSESLMGE